MYCYHITIHHRHLLCTLRFSLFSIFLSLYSARFDTVRCIWYSALSIPITQSKKCYTHPEPNDSNSYRIANHDAFYVCACAKHIKPNHPSSTNASNPLHFSKLSGCCDYMDFFFYIYLYCIRAVFFSRFSPPLLCTTQFSSRFRLFEFVCVLLDGVECGRRHASFNGRHLFQNTLFSTDIK